MGARTSGGSSLSRRETRRHDKKSAQERVPSPAEGRVDVSTSAEVPSPAARELELKIESLQQELDRLHREMEPLARFRALIDGADEAIFVVDQATGRFVDANQTALRWFGIVRDRLTSLSIHEVGAEFPLEHPQVAGARINETRDHQRPLICGRVHRRRDGTAFPVEVAVALRRFGSHTYTLVVARESRLGRQGGKGMEQQYEALLHLTRDAVCLCDHGGRIRDANEPFAKLLGYERSELLGLELRTLSVGMYRSTVFELRADEGELSRKIHLKLRKKDGSLLRSEMTVAGLGTRPGANEGFHCLVLPEKTGAERESPRERDRGWQFVRRHLFTFSLLAASVALAAFSWTDAVELTYPYPAGLPEWKWGLRILPPVLFALSFQRRSWRWVSRGVALGLAVVCLGLLLVYLNYMWGMPYELTSAVPGADAQIHDAVYSASAFSLTCLLVFGWLSRRLWVGPPDSSISTSAQEHVAGQVLG